MIKASLGKLDLSFDPVAMIIEAGFEPLPFRGEDALALRDMPFYHRDPFDRMLISQSLARNYPIVTDDSASAFQAYDCRLL